MEGIAVRTIASYIAELHRKTQIQMQNLAIRRNIEERNVYLLSHRKREPSVRLLKKHCGNEQANIYTYRCFKRILFPVSRPTIKTRAKE